MRLVVLQNLHFICIFIVTIKSELLTLTFQSDIVRIWAHTHLLQSKCLNQLRLITLATTVYLSQLPNPTPNYHSSSMLFPKCIINERCLFLSFSFFFQDVGRRVAAFSSYLYHYKTSVPDGNWLHTLLVKLRNARIQLGTTPK